MHFGRFEVPQGTLYAFGFVYLQVSAYDPDGYACATVLHPLAFCLGRTIIAAGWF